MGIEIDQQHGKPLFRQAGGQVDGGGGLADAPFLVGDSEDRYRHGWSFSGGPFPSKRKFRRREFGAVDVAWPDFPFQILLHLQQNLDEAHFVGRICPVPNFVAGATKSGRSE